MFKYLQRYKIEIVVFLLAIFLWAYVKTESFYDWAYKVPIEIINVKEGLAIANEVPSHAQVRFNGKGKTLISLALSRDYKIIIDANRNEGEHHFTLSKENVSILRQSFDVDIVELISPKQLTVVLDKFVEHGIPVVSEVQIKTENGYVVIGTEQIDPDSVLVFGPESLVRQIEFWNTDPHVLKNVNRDVKYKASLKPPQNDKISINRDDVIITADVQKLMERRMENVPVEVRNAPAGWKALVVPSKLNLILVGGVDNLTKLEDDQITAYIDWRRQSGRNDSDYPAYIITPEGISYRDVTPQRFKVVLEKR